MNLLLAVLERRLGLSLSQADVYVNIYVNIAGGVRMKEPAIDLGIIIAVISSYKDIVIDPRTLVFGEVGLSGEIRSVSQAPLRVREAEKLGPDRGNPPDRRQDGPGCRHCSQWQGILKDNCGAPPVSSERLRQLQGVGPVHHG